MQRSWFKRAGYRWIRALCRISSLAMLRIRVDGREHFPAEGGGLVCANHQSFLDPVLAGLCCDRRMNCLARQSLFRYPLLGPLIHFLDAIPLDRGGMGIRGLKETLRRLKRGELVLLFPEGTRTGDGRLLPLKPGFLILVRRGKVPIIPIGISGAYQAWPRHCRLPRPMRVHIAIGRPISPELVASLDDDQLLVELTQRIQACVDHAGRRQTP